MIKFTDLEFEDHNIVGGIQARHENISVIQGDFAYTSGSNEFEVGKTNDEGHWDVEGYCDRARVEEILNGAEINGSKESYDEVLDSLGVIRKDADKIYVDTTKGGWEVLHKLEYEAAKAKLKCKRLYIASMIFHGGLACWYFYLALFTDYMANPAVVGMWVAIAGLNAYFNYKMLRE